MLSELIVFKRCKIHNEKHNYHGPALGISSDVFTLHLVFAARGSEYFYSSNCHCIRVERTGGWADGLEYAFVKLR